MARSFLGVEYEELIGNAHPGFRAVESAWRREDTMKRILILTGCVALPARDQTGRSQGRRELRGLFATGRKPLASVSPGLSILSPNT